MPVVTINQHFIETGLQCGAGRKAEFTDRSLPGFFVEVTASSPGVGSYRLRYRDSSGRTRYASLGRTNVVSLEDARAAAKTMKAEIALRIADPSADKRAREAMMTFSDFWEKLCLPHLKIRKKTWAKDDERYRLRLKREFGHQLLSTISRRQIQAFHSDLVNQGLAPATANRYFQVLRRALNLATSWDLIAVSPATHIPLHREDNKIEPHLTSEELARLMTVLKTDKNRNVCLAVRWLLATGCRLGECLQATWSSIDRENRLWLIPASNNKSGRSRSVPLSETALGVLAELTTEHKFEYLFVNEKTGAPYRYISKTFNKLRTAAGLPWLRPHDCRHLVASWAVQRGVPLHTVGTLLGHSSPAMTTRYAHLNVDSLREATDAAAEATHKAS